MIDYEFLIKDPKAYLMRGWNIRSRVEAKQQRIEYWRSVAESVTAEVKQDGGFGSSYPKSKIESCAVKIADLQAELKEDAQELIEIEKSVQEAINLIPDVGNIRFMFELRYLNYLSWEAVAETVGYSERNLHLKHKTGLEQMKSLALAKI